MPGKGARGLVLAAATLPLWWLAREEPAAIVARGGTVVAGRFAAGVALAFAFHVALVAFLLLVVTAPPPTRRRRVQRVALAFASTALGLAIGIGGGELLLRAKPSLLPRAAYRYLGGPNFRECEPRYNVWDGPWAFRGKPNVSLPPLPTEPEFVRQGWSRSHPLADPPELAALELDEDGFRNPPGERAAEIVCCGDSYTFGWNLPVEASWPRRLGKRLGVVAHSLAFPCYCPSQEVAVFEAFGTSRKPRAVFMTFAEWNDVGEEEDLALWREQGSPHRAPIESDFPLEGWRLGALVAHELDRLPLSLYRHRGSPLEPLVATVGDRAIAYTFGPGAARFLTAKPEELRKRKGLALALEALVRGKERATAIGARFAVVMIPAKVHVLFPALPAEAQRELVRSILLVEKGVDLSPGDAAIVTRELLGRVDVLSELFQKEAAARGLETIDVLPPLRASYLAGVPPYFALDGHLDRAGNEIVAARVAAWLATN